MQVCHIVIINTGNKMPSFAFSSKDQVVSVVTFQIHTWVYLIRFMNQHIWNPLCVKSVHRAYIQGIFTAQRSRINFIFSKLIVAQIYITNIYFYRYAYFIYIKIHCAGPTTSLLCFESLFSCEISASAVYLVFLLKSPITLKECL